MVAGLRDALGRFPTDRYLTALIGDLVGGSPRFAELWQQRRPVARAPVRRKTFHHPELCEITLDWDPLAVQGADVNVIVYTAPAGSPEAETLALLGANRAAELLPLSRVDRDAGSRRRKL
jgi:hypothetical protein